MLSGLISATPWLTALGCLFTFVLTAVLLGRLKDKLPRDQGRKFAVEGTLSQGKARGAGVVFVPVFIVMSLLLCKVTVENALYLFFILLSMLSGYLDDASEKPWNEYKKGAIDLLIAGGITAVYIIYNGTTVRFALLPFAFTLPVWAFALISVALIWCSINVTNCTDGVDGLSASVVITTVLSFVLLLNKRGIREDIAISAVLFVICLLAYLLFNATPSIMLMGDAGSRAMGTFIAILALVSRDPFIFLLFGIVLILDGGLGLLKLFLLRFLKIRILANTRTPLHDHVRKVLNWSNTQTVFRFTIIQIIISLTVLWPSH
ncbi:MAG: phospho-N-acetylmuramoyl-pentapeptide-transferase [Lachnospiraceae bacterium]|nr:phospho-N-acetylmuramoyl-pentapeptide-transferase [Lachnospiraceae bacterium]